MATIPLTRELFVKKVSPLINHSSEFRFIGEKPAVIDFYAEWCSPCQMVAPVLEELSDLYDGKVDFYKVNVDEENELSTHFNIRSIPTLLLVGRDGAVQRFMGAMSRERLKSLVEALVE